MEGALLALGRKGPEYTLSTVLLVERAEFLFLGKLLLLAFNGLNTRLFDEIC